MAKRYEDKTKKDIVTEFTRPSVPPPDDRRKHAKPDKARTRKPKMPSRLRFSLEDGTTITEVELIAHHEILIGRRARKTDPQVGVDLEVIGAHQWGVSRVHAMVGIVRDTVMVQDLQSINGTFLDGEKLAPLKMYALPDGARLTLSKLTLVVHHIYA